VIGRGEGNRGEGRREERGREKGEEGGYFEY